MKKSKKKERNGRNCIRKHQSMRLWHYTFYHRLEKIIDSGLIKTTEMYTDEGEKPAVWLSANKDWERTVDKQIIENGTMSGFMSRDELFEQRVCLPARIEVDPMITDINSWNEFKRISGISSISALALEVQGYERGANPNKWFVSFEALPTSNWLSIEVWNGTTWTTDINGVLESDQSFRNPKLAEPSDWQRAQITLECRRQMKAETAALVGSGFNRKNRRAMRRKAERQSWKVGHLQRSTAKAHLNMIDTTMATI